MFECTLKMNTLVELEGFIVTQENVPVLPNKKQKTKTKQKQKQN